MEIIPLTNEETKSYLKQKVCHICRKEFSTDDGNKNTINYKIIIATPVDIVALLIMFVT